MFSFLGHYPLPKDVSTPQFAKVIQAVSLSKECITNFSVNVLGPKASHTLISGDKNRSLHPFSEKCTRWSVTKNNCIWRGDFTIFSLLKPLSASSHSFRQTDKLQSNTIVKTWCRLSLSCAKRKFALMGLLQRGLPKKHAAHSRSNWLLSNRVCNGTHPSHPSISIVKALDQPRDGVPMKNFWASRKVTNPFPSPEHLGQKKTLVEEKNNFSGHVDNSQPHASKKKFQDSFLFAFFPAWARAISNHELWVCSLNCSSIPLHPLLVIWHDETLKLKQWLTRYFKMRSRVGDRI